MTKSVPSQTPPVRSTDSSFYIESIQDALNFLDVNQSVATRGADSNQSGAEFGDGAEVARRPSWMKRGTHLQVLVTGSLYLVAGVLTLVDPTLGGTLSDD